MARKHILTITAALTAILLGPMRSDAQTRAPEVTQVTIDADGIVHLPAISVPPSSLSSDEAKKNFLDFVRGFAPSSVGASKDDDINAMKRLDNRLMRPGVEKLRAVFPVKIRTEMIGGVQTNVIEPIGGFATRNRKRVLINLRGGGLGGVSLLGGQMESIPIASLGAIKVITVDYHGAPERRYPSANEEIVAVYKALLKSYPSKNIGIYGCSDGAVLTAESIAWLQIHRLPLPGAIGMFGSGALVDSWGDSNYVTSGLMGWDMPQFHPGRIKEEYAYFSVADLDLKDPLVSPVYSPLILSKFPPSLLISGTRDLGLSTVVYTHAQLVKGGVKAFLHVWEGAPHCSFAQPVVDPTVPETREAWDVIVKFFEKYLGK